MWRHFTYRSFHLVPGLLHKAIPPEPPGRDLEALPEPGAGVFWPASLVSSRDSNNPNLLVPSCVLPPITTRASSSDLRDPGGRPGHPCPSTLPCTAIHCPPGHLGTAPVLLLGSAWERWSTTSVLSPDSSQNCQTHEAPDTSCISLQPSCSCAKLNSSSGGQASFPKRCTAPVTAPRAPPSVSATHRHPCEGVCLLWSNILSSQCEWVDLTPNFSLHADMTWWGNASFQLKRT